jgi:hypothetical protein
MSRICQEKFQVEYPEANDDDGHLWVSDKSARTKKGTPGREGRAGGDWPSKTMDNAVFYESLPPGADLEDQEISDQRVMPMTMGGESDVSRDWNPTAVREGWSPRALRPTDDQYTREHNDAFYDEMTVDGVTGFIERNNMLDRM